MDPNFPPQSPVYPPPAPQPVSSADRQLGLLLPFSELWTSPTKTISRLKHDPHLLWPLLLNAFAGIPLTLLALLLRADDDTNLLFTIAIAFFAGPVVGLLTGFISTVVVGAIGRGALDGTGTNAQVLRLTGWASVPRIYTVPVYLILIAVFGMNGFNDTSIWETWQTLLFWALIGLIIILEFWGFLCYILGLAEIMEFSATIAIWNYVAVLVQLYFWPRAILLIVAYIESQ